MLYNINNMRLVLVPVMDNPSNNTDTHIYITWKLQTGIEYNVQNVVSRRSLSTCLSLSATNTKYSK